MKGYVLIFLLLLIRNGYSQSTPPNIVFILADDLGYGDVSCFNKNGKIHTPNIDRIAEAGVRFTDAHSSSSVCTPTRYSILTGRYSWRSRLKNGVLVPYDQPLIEKGRTTMASMLKQRGYRTACIGKWHLGWEWPTTDGGSPIDNADQFNLDFSKHLGGGPLDIGFDFFFGMDAPNYPPYTYIENRNVVGLPSVYYSKQPYNDCRAGRGVEGWNLENILGDLERKSVNYIDEAAKAKKPFFLYLPITAPHTPIAPSTLFRGRSDLNVYADFVLEVDHFVGAIQDALTRNNINENTILVFTSDNGCSPEANFPLLASKGHNPNWEFRGNKADLFEGGHHVPLLLQWPGRIRSSFTIDQTVSLNDFMASFASITGYRLKNDEAEDSYDLLPTLLDPAYRKAIHEATVHHSFNGDFAIRKGKWKLLLTPGSGGWSFPSNPKELEDLPSVQLYDMDRDPGEKNNLQAQFPDVVKELAALLDKYKTTGRSTPIRK